MPVPASDHEVTSSPEIVPVSGSYDRDRLEAALGRSELLERALAWAGLTVSRLDAERVRVAADEVDAIVRARVDDLCYELTWEAAEQPPVTLSLRFQPQRGDAADARQWEAVLEPLPVNAGLQAAVWLPRALRALPGRMTEAPSRDAEPGSASRWIWVVAFVVLLLALGLAV